MKSICNRLLGLGCVSLCSFIFSSCDLASITVDEEALTLMATNSAATAEMEALANGASRYEAMQERARVAQSIDSIREDIMMNNNSIENVFASTITDERTLRDVIDMVRGRDALYRRLRTGAAITAGAAGLGTGAGLGYWATTHGLTERLARCSALMLDYQIADAKGDSDALSTIQSSMDRECTINE